MKAVRFYGAGEPLKIEDVPVPEIKDDEVLVEVKACGICGTDVHIAVEGALPTAYTPITLGHEPSGVIAEIGKNVKGLDKGARVSVYPQETCGECVFCKAGRDSLCLKPKVFGMQRDGALAEFIAVPARCLIKLPDEISFEIGAIISDAVSTPYHAITKRGNLKEGETVAVFGCGGLGYHGIKIAKLLGASKILAVDISDGSLDRALEAGADFAVNAASENPVKKIREATGGSGVDLSFEFIGKQQTIDQSVKALKKGGRAVVVGVGPEKVQTVPTSVFVGCEFSLIGSFGMDREDIQNVIKHILNGELDLSKSVTSKIRLSEINQGLNNLHDKVGNPIRIVVDMGKSVI